MEVVKLFRFLVADECSPACPCSSIARAGKDQSMKARTNLTQRKLLHLMEELLPSSKTHSTSDIQINQDVDLEEGGIMRYTT